MQNLNNLKKICNYSTCIFWVDSLLSRHLSILKTPLISVWKILFNILKYLEVLIKYSKWCWSW